MSVFEESRKKVLATAVENMEYFRNNPAHLAWVMMYYGALHRIDKNHPNPNDAILEVMKTLSEQDGNLLCDAFGVTVSNECEFPDTNPNIPLESKPNKTMKQWITLLTNPQYRFSTLYPDEFAVKNGLLCMIGTGYGWNKQGFIAILGTSGTDEVVFSGYTRSEATIDARVKQPVLEAISHKSIRKKVKGLMTQAYETAERINTGQDWFDSAFPDVKKIMQDMTKIGVTGKELLEQNDSRFSVPKGVEQKRKYSQLSVFSNLVIMPANAHNSYVKTGIGIAKEISADTEQNEQSRQLAGEFLNKQC
ncbi:hypothetical protein HY486_04275 [Candidatus Woesearchaeota archaeon]|nr:hypothetical protein [Candidatus Woesearchaeota archaeon]